MSASWEATATQPLSACALSWRVDPKLITKYILYYYYSYSPNNPNNPTNSINPISNNPNNSINPSVSNNLIILITLIR